MISLVVSCKSPFLYSIFGKNTQEYPSFVTSV